MKEPVTRIVWSLRYRTLPGCKLLRASGCWLAPRIFRNREQARTAARECREHQLDVVPVKVSIEIRVKAVKP